MANGGESADAYSALSPQVIFPSSWLSRECFLLSYTRCFLGSASARRILESRGSSPTTEPVLFSARIASESSGIHIYLVGAWGTRAAGARSPSSGDAAHPLPVRTRLFWRQKARRDAAVRRPGAQETAEMCPATPSVRGKCRLLLVGLSHARTCHLPTARRMPKLGQSHNRPRLTGDRPTAARSRARRWCGRSVWAHFGSPQLPT